MPTQNPVSIENMTHSLELPRIEGYRPHGFDGLDFIYDRICSELAAANNQPFYKTYQNADRYLFISASQPRSATPHFLIKVDGGYRDFQDGEHVSLSMLEILYFVDTKRIVLASAQTEGKLTSDIDVVINAINQGGFLSLPSKP